MIANRMRLKRLSTMCSCGGWLIAIGVIICFVGMFYSRPETADVLDPMLETTQDAWLLFMETHSFDISLGGVALMFIGAGVMCLADTNMMHTKNKLIGKWQWRVLL